MIFNYSYDEHTKQLTIYENSKVLAVISDVLDNELSKEQIMNDVIFELRGI